MDFITLKELTLGHDRNLNDEMRQELENDFFVIGQSKQAYLDKMIPYMRDMRNHLLQPTSLFIFVLTNSCNLNCVYCQAQSETSSCKGFMSKEIARKGVDIALQSPAKDITIEFQGGEPLLNFEVIKYIVEYTRERICEKNVSFNLVSNLSLLTEEIADYLIENNIQVSVSLDGDRDTHNNNRPFVSGEGSYDASVRGICMLRERNIELGAIQTTTRYSLGHAKEIIDNYIALGFSSIFIRPLTQLGFAGEHWDIIGYNSREFLDFYIESMNYILFINSNGNIFSEGHASIFLSKIIDGYSRNYMELRSPCGASIGQIAIYYDGNIYTCDEGRMVAEMGDDSFKLGSVFEDSYDSLLNSDVCKAVCASSCLESLPGCCDCVYQPYCGVCPVINYAIDGDLFAKNCYTNQRCEIYSGILDYIFSVIQEGDNSKIETFRRWVQ